VSSDRLNDIIAADREAAVGCFDPRALGLGEPGGAARDEALTGIITAYNEVTDRLKQTYDRLREEVARLREELARKNEELRRRERLAALGQMAAGLAHEIRNPLGGIGLHASVLEREVADRPGSQRLAQRIREGVRTLDRLVTDVLSFAQEGHLDVANTPLSVVVAESINHSQLAAAEARVSLVVDEADDPIVRGDAARLRQVLVNLILNAVEATGAGGHVTVRVSQAKEAGGAELCVSDDGPGIAPEDLERIFNPFVTTKSTGTGLGLSIVHRIIEAHGGGIRVQSTPGRGATFIVWLPLASSAETTAIRGGKGREQTA
jgi:signal transduction histidine kinase